jgi:hypothetical protein
VAAEVTEENGVGLNGVGLNGVGLNGVGLNGVGLNGVGLNGVGLNGTELTGTLQGTELRGRDFIGTELIGVLTNGRLLRLRIDDVARAAAPNDDVYLYFLSYGAKGRGLQDRLPLCGVDAAGEAIPAIPVGGFWDFRAGVPGGGSKTSSATHFTFGCKNTAIGKCVVLGYKPWRKDCAGASCEDHHQACTRMVRADYCGDGRSWTHNGRKINLYDGIGRQDDTEAWTFEAEWDVNGARCINSTRLPWSESDLDSCVTARMGVRGCGDVSSFGAGALLMNEHDRPLLQLSDRRTAVLRRHGKLERP